jgi:hypothetical protein
METLVSNIEFDGKHTDPKLIDPYGVLVKGSHIWVSSVTSSLVIKYKCTGEMVSSISVPSPTGMCFGKDDIIYVASNTGVIYWLTTKGTTANVYFTIERSPTSVGGIAYHKHKLYIAVFSFGYVQVYDTRATAVPATMQQLPGSMNSMNSSTTTVMTPKEMPGLVDKQLAEFGYVPINVAVICKILYVTYGNGSIVPGFGYVNQYDFKSGTFSRLINRGIATYPYGTASYGDQLYIANGSGYINIYSKCGNLVKTLKTNSNSQKFYSDGLRSITIEGSKLYYVSANDLGKMGSLGVVSLSSSCKKTK